MVALHVGSRYREWLGRLGHPPVTESERSARRSHIGTITLRAIESDQVTLLVQRAYVPHARRLADPLENQVGSLLRPLVAEPIQLAGQNRDVSKRSRQRLVCVMPRGFLHNRCMIDDVSPQKEEAPESASDFSQAVRMIRRCFSRPW
jgi:hypothetical protein